MATGQAVDLGAMKFAVAVAVTALLAVHGVAADGAVPFCTGDVFGAPRAIEGKAARKGRFAAIEGGRLYSGGVGCLAVFDIAADPAHPRLLGEIEGLSTIRQIAVQDGIVYAVARACGLWIVDCRIPERPSVLGHFPSVSNCTGVDVAGNVCIIGGSKSGIEYIDVSDPRNPRLIGCDRIEPVESQSVFYRDGTLFSGEWGGMCVTAWDVRDMSARRRLAVMPLASNGDGVWLDGDMLYAATGFSVADKRSGGKPRPRQMGLEIYDVSNPSSPRHVSRVDFEFLKPSSRDSWIVRANGGMAFCAMTQGGLYAVDVSDPASPKVVDRWLAKGNPTVLSVEIGDGVVYVTTQETGTWVIPAKGAKRKDRVRGTPPVNAHVRPPRKKCPKGLRRWLPSDPSLQCNVTGLAVKDDICYAAAGTAGLFVLRLSRDRIDEVTRIPLAEAMDAAVAEGRLFVAAGTGGWIVYDVTEPESPKEIFRIPGTFARDVYAYGDGTRWAGLNTTVYDISNPASPKRLVCLVNQSRYNKFLSPGLIGGHWTAGNSALKYFGWADLTAQKVVETKVGGYKSKTGGICPFRDGALIADNGGWAIVRPGATTPPEMRRFPKGSAASGIPRWDGGSRVLLSGAGPKASLWDFSDGNAPKLVRTYTLPGRSDVAAFWRGVPVFPAWLDGIFIEVLLP